MQLLPLMGSLAAAAPCSTSSEVVAYRHLHSQSLQQSFFPARACRCSTRCSSPAPLVVPARANDPAASTPCFVNDEDSASLPEFARLEDGIYGAECFTTDAALGVRCLTPGDLAPARGIDLAGQPARMLFVLGDSHAAALVAGLSAAVKGSMGVAWTAALWGGGFNGEWPDLGEAECEEDCPWLVDAYHETHTAVYVERLLGALRMSLQPGDVVTLVTSELRMPHTSFVQAQTEFLRGIASTVNGLGAHLMLIADVPKLVGYPGQEGDCPLPDVNDAHMYGKCTTAVADAIHYTRALHAQVDGAFAALAAEVQQGGGAMTYIDAAWMYGKLCDLSSPQHQNHVCGPNVPGTPTIAYVDDEHLSTAGSLYLGPFFACFFEDHGLLHFVTPSPAPSAHPVSSPPPPPRFVTSCTDAPYSFVCAGLTSSSICEWQGTTYPANCQHPTVGACWRMQCKRTCGIDCAPPPLALAPLADGHGHALSSFLCGLHQ